jgi:hypothetical protein
LLQAVTVVLISPKVATDAANEILSKSVLHQWPKNQMIKLPPTSFVQCMRSFAVGFVDVVAVIAVVSNTVCSCRCLLSMDAVEVAVAAAFSDVVMATAADLAVAVV